MIIKDFFIDKKVILLMDEYDQHGNQCSRIMVEKTTFLVDRPPLHLLDDTLKYIGFDLRGAIAGAKYILNKTVMCPIIVNPYQSVCLFPSKSPQKQGCIWFNPDHIINTKAIGNKTQIELSTGHFMLVDAKLTSFNNKLQTAIQLKRLSKERGIQASTLRLNLDPPKRQQLLKKKSGKYNFDILEEKIENPL